MTTEQGLIAQNQRYDLSAKAVDTKYNAEISNYKTQLEGLYQKADAAKKAEFLEAAKLGFLVKKDENGNIISMPSDNAVSAEIEAWATGATLGKTAPQIVKSLLSAISAVSTAGPQAMFYALGESRKALALPYESGNKSKSEMSLEEELKIAGDCAEAEINRDTGLVLKASKQLSVISEECKAAKKTLVQIDISKLPRSRDGGYVTENGATMYSVDDLVLRIFGQEIKGGDLLENKAEPKTAESATDLTPVQTYQLSLRNLKELAQGQGPLYRKLVISAIESDKNCVKAVAEEVLDILQKDAEKNGVELSDDKMVSITGLERYKAQKLAKVKEATKGRALL